MSVVGGFSGTDSAELAKTIDGVNEWYVKGADLAKPSRNKFSISMFGSQNLSFPGNRGSRLLQSAATVLADSNVICT